MSAKAKKLKIRIRKGKWFRLSLPGISFRFAHKISNFVFKHMLKDQDFDPEEINQYMNAILTELARMEPFVLVDVDTVENSERVCVRIETI